MTFESLKTEKILPFFCKKKTNRKNFTPLLENLKNGHLHLLFPKLSTCECFTHMGRYHGDQSETDHNSWVNNWRRKCLEIRNFSKGGCGFFHYVCERGWTFRWTCPAMYLLSNLLLVFLMGYLILCPMSVLCLAKGQYEVGLLYVLLNN